MEDSYQCIQDLRIFTGIKVSYFGVFDGHGGDSCAKFLKEHLHLELTVSLTKIAGSRHFTDFSQSILAKSHNFYATLEILIREAYSRTDLLYQMAEPHRSKVCGSTAVVCLIIGTQLVCINLGDARAVLCRNKTAIDLSVDYKASRKDEQERIKSQGGFIIFGRVFGRLAVTRSFGDFQCKQIQITNEQTQEKEMKNFVLNEPEIRYVQLSRTTDDFIVLASDGLFDRFSSDECISLAREKFLTMSPMEQDPLQVARCLVHEAVSQRVNSDNTTVIVVALNPSIE
jgi:protein phosphatase PTC2/3